MADFRGSALRNGPAAQRIGIVLAAGLFSGMAAMLTPAAAQDIAMIRSQEQVQDLITVTGTADVKADPDLAEIRLGVMNEAATAGKASSDNSAIMTRVIEAIRQMGVADKDIQTSNLNLETEYDDSNNAPPRIRGFKATNVVVMDVRELGKVGAILDTSLAAGANQVEGIEFRKNDDAVERTEALRKAAHQAADKARTLADALGAHLGGVASVSEGVENRPFPMPMMARGAMMSAETMPQTPVMAGQVLVSASVTVQYHILP